MQGPNRQPARQPSVTPHFPFDQSYQMALFRLLLEDGGFAYALRNYLKPHFFEHGVLVWGYSLAQRYFETYGAMPSLSVLRNEVRRLEPQLQMLYGGALEQVANTPISDEGWLKDNVLEFVKRNVFVENFLSSRDLYNQGKTTEAYDRMAAAMDEVGRVAWELVDREWHYENLRRRHIERSNWAEAGNEVPTLIPRLDDVLQGGLSKGELGIWVAYYKTGKSTMLLNLGLRATRAAQMKTVHFVLEGSKKQVAAKYDAAFAELRYWDVKRGYITEEAIEELEYNYSMLKQTLVLRGFTDRWDVTAKDLEAEIKELEAYYRFKPDLLIVDYGDLMHGHRGRYKSEYEDQRDAFRDLKTLANRGYACWTASQAQRPKADAENKPHVIRARQIADCIAKVHIADFLGSLNATEDEKDRGELRVYADLYRDNEAGKLIKLKTDFSMGLIYTFGPDDGEAPRTVDQGPPLGYEQARMPL